MILIKKGEVNEINVSVSDLAEGRKWNVTVNQNGNFVTSTSDPSVDENYTFTFTNNTTNQKIETILQRNVSGSTIRYDQFILNEGDHDFDEGYWSYEISSEDGIIVDKGKALVQGDEEALNEYTADDTYFKHYKG